MPKVASVNDLSEQELLEEDNVNPNEPGDKGNKVTPTTTDKPKFRDFNQIFASLKQIDK